MPNEQLKQIVIDDLSKGLNTFDPETKVPKGFYVDAQNMVFNNTKNLQTIGGLTKLNTTGVPSGNVVWVEPYTTSAGVTTYLVATDTGRLYQYTAGTDTWRHVLQGLATGNGLVWSHVPFRGVLFLANGEDFPMKWDGTNIVLIGGMWNGFGTSQLIADFESDEDAIWAGGTIRTTDPKEGTQSREVVSGSNAQLTYAADRNFLTGLLGAPDFTTTDDLFIWAKRTAGAGAVTIRFRFGNTADTVYFEAPVSHNPAGSAWTRIILKRNNFVLTGAPVWSAIRKFTIFVDGAGNTIEFDWATWQYKQDEFGPPSDAAYLEMYAQQLCAAGQSADPVQLKYSDAGSPDYFPASNTARFSGGRHALESADQITCLRSYFDELIVGKVNSSWTFSGTGTNTSISALPLTIGITSNRAIVETPWSLHFLYGENIFGARLTSRGLVSTNITSKLLNVDNSFFPISHHVAIRHDRSHTVRWSFRDTGVSGENSLGLIYDYQLDAWAGAYTPRVRYYSKHLQAGISELLAVQYDGFIRRVDVGTTFDGTAIESFVTLPWQQSQDQPGNVVIWKDVQIYKRGTATINIDARFADDPTEFAAATFTTFEASGATPDSDKQYSYLGRTSRWMQLRIRATSLAFELLMPITIRYIDQPSRV